MEMKLHLENLSCSHCAQKIEKSVAEMAGVSSVILNFGAGTMDVELVGEKDSKEILEEIKKVVTAIESDVVVRKTDDKKEKEKDFFISKSNLLLALGTVLFLCALIFDFSFWVSFSLFVSSYLIIGYEILLKAFKNILKRQLFDENFLMTIATIGAFCIKEFPEAVAVMLFYRIGETFQSIAVNKSRKSIKALMDIKPDYANMIINGEEKKVNPENVEIGDIIIVKPGEKVPLDGIIISGSTSVDTSALTGESLPRNLEKGEEILSGSINLNGLIEVMVTHAFSESTVNRIIELVENASSRKAETENFITKFARYYTPFVVFTAIALAILPPIFIKGAAFSEWLYRALVFLVISCPCALVISIPLSFFGGIGGASKKGILVKGGNYLEALNYATKVVFDKTGTLTKGSFTVKELNPQNGFSKEDLLRYAAIAEVHSNHPIAKSIINAYGKSIAPDSLEKYEELAGHGIRVSFEGKEILVGNKKMMDHENIEVIDENYFGTLVHVAVDKIYAGFIVIVDEIKSDAKETINSLRNLGIKDIIMLTGDNNKTGEAVAKELNIDKVYTELLPEDKVEKIEQLLSESDTEKLIFVGDGINDAPVLARADIGVAMGGLGSDAAIEASDLVIMNDEPSKLVSAIKIARRTKKIVWQNIIFSIGVKFFVLLLGALGLATMWGAVFADVGVALLAVLNSMRVMRVANL